MLSADPGIAWLFIEASLEELPVSANLGQSCLATKISAPGPSIFGWFRHTNRAPYRTNPDETKEIQHQVQALLDKGYIRESLSPCSVPVLLVTSVCV